MRRREFAKLVAATVAWPIMAGAQQRKMPVVGCLFIATPERSAWWVEAWRKGLGEAGFVEGRTVAVEYRWANGDPDRIPGLAADLVARPVDAIVTTTEPAAAAAKLATTVIPIVFAHIDDPVGVGLVESLIRPGGNVTGIATFDPGAMEAKRLQLLHEIVPTVTRIGYLMSTRIPVSSALSLYGHRADLGEKREPRETVYENCRKMNKQWRRILTRHHRDREAFP